MLCDGVFEGGGVRGIGHVGAIRAIEEAGYQFANVAGTSAGAIVAGLLAVGYTAREIEQEMQKLNYRQFRDATGFDALGVPGILLNLSQMYGAYSSAYFHDWFSGLLKRKGKTKFGDIANTEHTSPAYKLQVVAADISRDRLLLLPEDIQTLGIAPDDLSIASAVRMSMSIPLFYQPVKIEDAGKTPHYIVDGGILSNYPVWTLDDGRTPLERPVFGFRFTDPARNIKRLVQERDMNLVTYMEMLLGSLVRAQGHFTDERGDAQRTIHIPVLVAGDTGVRSVSATDFDLTPAQAEQLYQNGYNAGKLFLSTWDYSNWQEKYRT